MSFSAPSFIPEQPDIVSVSYIPQRVAGRFARTSAGLSSPIWERLRSRLASEPASIPLGNDGYEIPWPLALQILRELGSKSVQATLNFRFKPDASAQEQVRRFAEEVRSARAAKGTLTSTLSIEQLEQGLLDRGFIRKLKPFQIEDVLHLLALPNGANFSVPGAGKTTVTFALHIMTRKPGSHFLVICPKAAFGAWRAIVKDCMSPTALDDGAEEFVFLDGSDEENDAVLRSGRTRFVMSYDLMVRQQQTIANYLARQPVHVVLDEAHRMKAGGLSQRGSYLLSIATLPVRRDILTGTPMPQGASDLAAQLGFLWPGQGLDIAIERGAPPREVLGNLYVRTTKNKLGLPEVKRHFHQVNMAPAQLGLYSLVRDEALRQLTQTIRRRTDFDFIAARRSVMRLLQLSANPVLALRSVSSMSSMSSSLLDKVLDEGASTKMHAVADHARRLAKGGKKVVIWTIFTGTILEMEKMLSDLNPVTIYGAIPTIAPDVGDGREFRLRRFHNEDECQVLIANPAAAGEGISLHEACHDAIYLDRSYVSTHYLQSIDRIHRLGLKPGTETNIHIYETKAPPAIGSIDFSVRRRLITKIRGLQQLLDDPDLHKIVLDEESVEDPIDYSLDLQDLVDLVEELEGRAPVAEDE
jgi:SNF2 family DNA or RNA helicase